MQSELHPFWEAVTRLGASKLVLPFLALVLVMLVARGNLRGALLWAAAVGAAMAADFAWKVAYRATGIGFVELDFNAPSGHSLLSAAIYPVFLGWLFARGRSPHEAREPDRGPSARPADPSSRRIAASFASLHEHAGLSRGGFGLGVALAALIAFSRLVLHYHSPAEAVVGFCLGYPASRVGRHALRQVTRPPRAVLLAAFAVMIACGATLLTELPQLDIVRNAARAVTGRSSTFERNHLLMDYPPASQPRTIAKR